MISISDFQNSFTKSEPVGTNADNQEKCFGSIDFDKQNRAFFSFATVTKDSRIAADCFSGINREVVELYLKLTKKNAMSFSWLDEESASFILMKILILQICFLSLILNLFQAEKLPFQLQKMMKN